MHTGRASFGRALRLLKPVEFKRVFQNSRRSSDRCFTVLFLPNDRPDARLGTAVAKKILRRAVDRNRVKRLIRESFRLRQHDLAGLDLVVMCARGIDLSNLQQLRDSLDRHWTKAAQAKSVVRD
ncbi:ribonuclease P protein component [Sedimenticola hydrogenitrophicus]|uniref:ribonuclease P protein component n=1 Tax=Sedimenticola hydrogenitrophicus TaxID=2967975 RepID=UPI0021A84342|nr:ribonuclease P protein component [Sedimenticola hydrogenitrophicus]